MKVLKIVTIVQWNWNKKMEKDVTSTQQLDILHVIHQAIEPAKP